MMDGASKDDPRTKEEVPVPFVEGSSLHGCSKNRPPTKQNRLLIGDPTLSWKVLSSFSPHSFLFSVSRRAFLPRCCGCCSLFPWLMYCCHELGIAAWSSYSFSRQFVPTYTHVPCFYWSPVSTTGYCFCLSLSLSLSLSRMRVCSFSCVLALLCWHYSNAQRRTETDSQSERCLTSRDLRRWDFWTESWVGESRRYKKCEK